jgi:glycosyltransferase involved in cell wall biosynthesis
MGHEVTVYSPDEHPYQQSEWNGIRIRHVFNKESKLGIWGTLLYDYLCLRDAVRSDFDVILELGYVPVAIFYPFRRRGRAPLVTNMDGLEWKRSKWNAILRRFARLTEVLGARHSDALIADNEAIREYLRREHGRESHFIPYGAEPYDDDRVDALESRGVSPGAYHMLIARMEPENNVEMILDGYVASGDSRPFLAVGKTGTRHGQELVAKYRGNERIRFLGGIYDYGALSALRRHAHLYFHGHSVGGTNPSLVEAMASGAMVAAHDNPFNRSVLEAGALYFAAPGEVADLIRSDTSGLRESFVRANREKVLQVYNWKRIAAEHVRVFELAIAAR